MTAYPDISSTLTQELANSGQTQYKALIIAQDNTTLHPEKTVFEFVQVGDVGTTFTADQVLGDMIKEWKVINGVTQLDVMSLKDPDGGTAATGKFTLDGTATTTGDIIFHVTKYTGGNSTENRDGCKFIIPVTIGMKAEDVITAFTAAFNDDVKIPVKPLVKLVTQADAKTIEFAATNTGEVGNSYILAYDLGTVKGITAIKTDFVGGTLTPTITEAELNTALVKRKYDMIVVQDAMDIEVFKKFIKAREQVDSEDYSGIVFYTASADKTDNAASSSLVTLAQLINSHLFVLLGTSKTSTSTWGGNQVGLPETTKQAQITSTIALRNTQGADISTIMTSKAIDSQTGGDMVYALPFQNTILTNMTIPNMSMAYENKDIYTLNNLGIMVLDWDGVNNQVVLSKGVTCVTKDSGEKFHNLNTLIVTMIVRQYININLKKRYGQSILAKSNPSSQDNIVTLNDIVIYTCTLLTDLANNGLISPDKTDLNDAMQFVQKNAKADYDNGAVYIAINFKPLGQLDVITTVIKVL